MEILQAISQVGFPIVSFLLMFWFANKTIKENTQALLTLKDMIEELRRCK